jgi:hypothetical protein
MTPDDACAAIDAAVVRSHTSGPVAIVVVQGDARVTDWAAACWAYRRRRDYPRDMYEVDLSDYRRPGGVDLSTVLRVQLRGLGVWPWRIPKTLAGRAAVYHKRVSTRRVLLVIRNSDAAAQIRPFIAGMLGSVVLVTSRGRLGGLITDRAEFVTFTEASEPRENPGRRAR